MGFRKTTSVFSRGALNPDLLPRDDLDIYEKGALVIENLRSLPMGGLAHRPGMITLADLGPAAGAVRLEEFIFDPNPDSGLAFLHVFRSNILRIFNGDSEVASLPTNWSGEILGSMDVDQALETMVVVHDSVRPQRIVRQGSNTSWGIGDVPLTNIPQHTFPGSSTAEPTWSDTRGWPRAIVFHDGRMYLANTRSRPSTAWGSKVDAYFNFATTTEALDDEAVEVTLTEGSFPAIRKMYSLDRLFIFSSGGIYTVDSLPITPKDFMPVRRSEVPAANISICEAEGAPLFASGGEPTKQQSIFELLFDDKREGHVPQDVGYLSAHLIRPRLQAMTFTSATSAEVANNLYVVNGDGTLAVFNVRRNQNIAAWVLYTTDGKFRHVKAVNGVVYCAVERGDRLYLERLDDKVLLDAAKVKEAEAPATEWPGYAHLAGRSVHVYGDGRDFGYQIVPAGGTITTPFPVSKVVAGLPIPWRVKLLPLALKTEEGNLVGQRHRSIKAIITVRDTGELNVNGEPIEFARYGAAIINGAPPVYSGQIKRRVLGWRVGGDPSKTLELHGTQGRNVVIQSIQQEVGA